MLGHTSTLETSPSERIDQEFAADRLALQLTVNSLPTLDAIAAGILGAWFFLSTAYWVERLDREKQVLADHPSAKNRMVQMREDLNLSDFSGQVPIDKCLKLLTELNAAFEDYWVASEWQRDDLLADFTSLDSLLQESVKERNPLLIRDQIPRWILLGAPQRFSRTLARTRLRLEAAVSRNPSDAEARAKLGHLLWVYSVASQEPSGSLAEELQHAYHAVMIQTS